MIKIYQHSKAKMLRGIQIAAAATALLIASVGIAQAGDNGGETTREIAPGVYSFAPEGSHYYSMFVVTNDGVAAFETVNPKHPWTPEK